VNAPIRLLFALSLLLLSACAGTAYESGGAAEPRAYRESLVVEQPVLRSSDVTTTMAVGRSHERSRLTGEHVFVTTVR
jgi:hypothetical protein